jgi:hypothetical protein
MQGYRVLCVTTHQASEAMWSGYAGNHKGIVLRIEANVEKDSKFQLFHPVTYREKRPSLYEDAVSFIEFKCVRKPRSPEAGYDGQDRLRKNVEMGIRG